MRSGSAGDGAVRGAVGPPAGAMPSWASNQAWTRAIVSLRCSPGSGRIGGPKRTQIGCRKKWPARKRLGQLTPGGIASPVPSTKIGRMAKSWAAARTAAAEGGAGGARVQLPARAVARAGALRVEEEVPALADEAVQVVRGALLHAAALAGDRHGAEEQGHGRRDPALAIEVVGRRGHGGALAPRARKRAQDRRRVHVARVVGDEDDRRARGAEYLAALDPAADVPGHHRPEEA